MAKVNIKSDKITPFGGIYYASKAFYALYQYSSACLLRQESRSLSSTLLPYALNGQGRQEDGG